LSDILFILFSAITGNTSECLRSDFRSQVSGAIILAEPQGVFLEGIHGLVC